MTSQLTKAILAAVRSGKPPYTAQGITSVVRKSIPTADHRRVTAELFRLVAANKVKEVKRPFLPARFKLPRQARAKTTVKQGNTP